MIIVMIMKRFCTVFNTDEYWTLPFERYRHHYEAILHCVQYVFVLIYLYLHSNSTSGICAVVSKIICPSTKKLERWCIKICNDIVMIMKPYCTVFNTDEHCTPTIEPYIRDYGTILDCVHYWRMLHARYSIGNMTLSSTRQYWTHSNIVHKYDISFKSYNAVHVIITYFVAICSFLHVQ
jgi:hypothetical protein